MPRLATPSQTVGPFFSFGLCVSEQNRLVDPGDEGAIELRGRVLDGEGQPVPDAMVEIWQRDARGGQRAGFGWGRSGTDAAGRYRFVTVKPGGAAAPHVTMLIFARGLLKPVLTRVYFPDEPLNSADPLLQALAEAERDRLVGQARENGDIEFDVHLQGADQTTFLVLGPTPDGQKEHA